MDMEVDDNEDPEERDERESRGRAVPRMRRVATWAGWVSLAAFCSGFIFLVISTILESALSRNHLYSFFVLLVIACLGVIAPFAALLDLGLLVRLRMFGERDLKDSVMPGVPGALLSIAFSVALIRTMMMGR